MWNHGWWGMLAVGILNRVGVDIVVLRRYVVARWIVPRHDGAAERERRSRGVVVVGDGMLAVIGSTSFKVSGCRDSGRSPVFDNGSAAGSSGTGLRRVIETRVMIHEADPRCRSSK